MGPRQEQALLRTECLILYNDATQPAGSRTSGASPRSVTERCRCCHCLGRHQRLPTQVAHMERTHRAEGRAQARPEHSHAFACCRDISPQSPAATQPTAALSALPSCDKRTCTYTYTTYTEEKEKRAAWPLHKCPPPPHTDTHRAAEEEGEVPHRSATHTA